MQERNSHKTITSDVVTAKMKKTFVVSVDTYRKLRLYGKRVKSSTKFHAHDENNTAKLGDVVTIMETRPLSKTKHFVLVKVEKAHENI